jgi:hypothetical protein
MMCCFVRKVRILSKHGNLENVLPRSEFLMAVTVKINVLPRVTSCSLVKSYRCFDGNCYHPLQSREISVVRKNNISDLVVKQGPHINLCSKRPFFCFTSMRCIKLK